MLGVSTGGRISELLSLQIGDVWQNRQNVHEMLKKAFIAAGLNGKLATHSLRKSFAQRVYEHSGDIYLVQELLGHKSVAMTQKYIGINYATAREAVETMALGHEPYRMLLLSRSIKKNTDEQLHENMLHTPPILFVDRCLFLWAFCRRLSRHISRHFSGHFSGK